MLTLVMTLFQRFFNTVKDYFINTKIDSTILRNIYFKTLLNYRSMHFVDTEVLTYWVEIGPIVRTFLSKTETKMIVHVMVLMIFDAEH